MNRAFVFSTVATKKIVELSKIYSVALYDSMYLFIRLLLLKNYSSEDTIILYSSNIWYIRTLLSFIYIAPKEVLIFYPNMDHERRLLEGLPLHLQGKVVVHQSPEVLLPQA